MNRIVLVIIGLSGLLVAALVTRKDLFFLKKASADDNKRRQHQTMLAPNPAFVTPAVPPAPDPITKLSGKAPARPADALCTEFFNRIFSEDFRSIAADRMNHLPDVGGCRPEGELVNQVLTQYQAVCRGKTVYGPDYASWPTEQKTQAATCLSWIWLVRSAIVADRLKGTDLNSITNPATLTAWLFGTLISMDFDRMSAVSARLLELDPSSLPGAKGVLMKRAIAIANEGEKTGKKLDEAFWSDTDREWRRARELGPKDPEVDLFGILIRTRNMDLPRLKKELEDRQGPEYDADPNTHYLRAYYASKTGKKEDAIPVLEMAAARFPSEAKRFHEAAESCRTQEKCNFQMSFGVKFDNLFKVDDIIH